MSRSVDKNCSNRGLTSTRDTSTIPDMRSVSHSHGTTHESSQAHDLCDLVPVTMTWSAEAYDWLVERLDRPAVYKPRLAALFARPSIFDGTDGPGADPTPG